MIRPKSRFAVPSSEIDKAVNCLIKIASQYPDDNLAKAIDDVRIIVRKQELYINEIFSLIERS